MVSLSIRKLDEETLLRIRAAQHGVSMEAEARCILKEAVSAPDRLGDLALQICGPRLGVDLQLPERRSHQPPGIGRMILLDANVVSELMKVQPAESSR